MDAILPAPDHLVRATLIALCNDRTQLKKAIAYLGKMGHSDAVHAPSHSGTGNGRKRKAEHDVRICVQCQEPYHESDKPQSPCKFHSGDLEHDDTSSVWDDWDENCFGEQDCEESREEYPDGFTWSCCGKNGTHPGCTRGPHRAVGATRGRYSSQDCPQTHGSPDEGPNSEHDDEGEDDEHDEE